MSITIAKDQKKHYRDKEQWEKDIDNFDRVQRRRDKIWRKRVVKIDAAKISQLMDNNWRLHLDQLNDLDPEAG